MTPKQIRQNNFTVAEESIFVRDKTSLWTRGAAYSPSGFLELGFRFTLPADLLSPFSCSRSHFSVVIRYDLEAVGVSLGHTAHE